MREYSKAEEAEQADGASGSHSLRSEADGKRRQLEQWSASAYGEVRTHTSLGSKISRDLVQDEICGWRPPHQLSIWGSRNLFCGPSVTSCTVAVLHDICTFMRY